MLAQVPDELHSHVALPQWQGDGHRIVMLTVTYRVRHCGSATWVRKHDIDSTIHGRTIQVEWLSDNHESDSEIYYR